MSQMNNVMPLVFSALNLACGIMLVVISLDNDFCLWYRIFFGVSIAWVAITTELCEHYALVWFPLWNRSFGFMGSTFIFLACGGYNWLRNGSETWNGFFFFFIWGVGIAYCIIWICQIVGCCGCPLPIPLLHTCRGQNGGGGGGGNKAPQKTTTTTTTTV